MTFLPCQFIFLPCRGTFSLCQRAFLPCQNSLLPCRALENSPLEIERTDDYFIAGSVNSESLIPGLYAAGDILMHEGKLNLIAGTFQDAANAVNKAKLYLKPECRKSRNGIFTS